MFQKTNRAEKSDIEVLSEEDQAKIRNMRMASVIDPKQDPDYLKRLNDTTA